MPAVDELQNSTLLLCLSFFVFVFFYPILSFFAVLVTCRTAKNGKRFPFYLLCCVPHDFLYLFLHKFSLHLLFVPTLLLRIFFAPVVFVLKGNKFLQPLVRAFARRRSVWAGGMLCCPGRLCVKGAYLRVSLCALASVAGFGRFGCGGWRFQTKSQQTNL
jgi:hypothetical protein